MNVFSRWLALSVVLFAGAPLAQAGVVVALPQAEFPSPVGGPEAQTFDLAVDLTEDTTAFNSFGFGIRIRIEPQAGAVGNAQFVEPFAATGAAVFDDVTVTINPEGNELFAQGFNTSAQTVTDGGVLFSFSVDAAPGTLGQYNLSFFDAPGEPTSLFDDAGSVKGGVTFADGSITYTPEPASLAIVAAGGMLLLGRRRRAQV